MNKKYFAAALVLMAYGSFVSAQAPVPAPLPADAEKGESAYVGASTRVGLGYDDKTRLRGELYRVFSESDTSVILGEGWISRNAGGLKFSYNWLPQPATGPVDPTVRKFFAAADRNADGDAKVTVGGGFEKASFFGGLYGSAGVTGRREIGDNTVATVETIQGNDGRPFLQDITTSVRTRIFERPYDYGVGARIGHFYEPALIRLTLGADYEWGRDTARQTTVSLGVEKYFYNAPYSVALNVEHYRKSGGFESGTSDNRVMAMFRYEFGGHNFRPIKEYRMVEAPARNVPATIPAPLPPDPPRTPAVAMAPSAVPAAAPVPRTEKRLVKTTASMSADAFFEFDKSTLTPAAKSALDGVIGRIKTSGFAGNLRLTGHTCNIGSAAYNLGLSERRAVAVKSYLIAIGGLQPGVILAEGRGLTEPKYPNTSAERHKNRRVDLEFVTYEDKVAEITLPPEPAPPAAQPAPAPAAVPAPVAPPAPVAAVEWRREVIEKEPTWVRRALRQSLPHKQTVDVYRHREQLTTTTQGEKRYINRPPAAVNDAFAVPFNSVGNVFDVLANDSDPDGDALTITAVGSPAHGTAVVTAGKVSYTVASGYSGTDSFTYSIADGKGGTASATVTVSIQQGSPNRAPVAQNDTYVVQQNSTNNNLGVLANDSDADGDALTITAVGAPAHGTASIANNRISYTPAVSYAGSDSFTYTIADGRGGSASATVAITVQVPNHPPVAQNDAFTVSQNSTGNSLNVLANDSDPDSDALTITSVGAPAHGTASVVGNRVSYTPAPAYSGSDSFTYSIADGRGGTASASVSITVTSNNPPLARDDTFLINQHFTDLDVLANDSDPDGDSLTIIAVTQPPVGNVAISADGKMLRYTMPFMFNRTTFTYTISDGHGGTATATVLLIDP